MKFDHRVNFNGKYYAAGEDVPIPEKAEKPVPPVAPTEEVVPKRRGRARKED